MKKHFPFIVILFSLFIGNNVYAKDNAVTTNNITNSDDDYVVDIDECVMWGNSDYDNKGGEIFLKKFKSKKYEQCMDGKISDFEMAKCANEEVERQDIVLNKKYKKLMNSLPKNQRIALRNYQREWIKENEKVTRCFLPPEHPFSYGTIHYSLESHARLQTIVQRIDEFDQCLSAKKINRNSKGCENLYPLK